jgi:hypothetical protein
MWRIAEGVVWLAKRACFVAVGWGAVADPAAAQNRAQPPEEVQPRIVEAGPGQSAARADISWRYRWYGGRWWYWLPAGRWVFWTGDRWVNYPPPAGTVVYYYVEPVPALGHRQHFVAPYYDDRIPSAVPAIRGRIGSYSGTSGISPRF